MNLQFCSYSGQCSMCYLQGHAQGIVALDDSQVVVLHALKRPQLKLVGTLEDLVLHALFEADQPVHDVVGGEPHRADEHHWGVQHRSCL